MDIEADTSSTETKANGLSETLISRRVAFGSKLKSCRDASGVSEASLSQATRISVAFIKALENGELEKLPGEIFGRGFVKNICKLTGADAEDLLSDYTQCWSKEEIVANKVKDRQAQSIPSFRQAAASFKENSAKISLAPFFSKITLLDRTTFGSVAAGALVIGIIWLLSNSVENKSQLVAKLPASQSASSKQVVKPADASKTIASNIEVAKVATEIMKTKASVSVQPRNAPPIDVREIVGDKKTTVTEGIDQTVKLIVSSPVRIRMKFDSGKTETKQLKPDSYVFTFADGAQFLIFDAGAVKIDFNGKSIGSLGQSGRVRRISFKAEPAEPAAF